MGNLLDYVKNELSLLPKCSVKSEFNNVLLKLVETFTAEYESSLPPDIALEMFERLLHMKPLTSLTGEDNEWEISYEDDDKIRYHNKRCTSVFKDIDKDGNIICIRDINSVECSDNGGITWYKGACSSHFMEEITFPYFPPIESRKVYVKDITNGDYTEITDKDEIQRIYKKCRKEMNDARSYDEESHI